MNAHERTCSFVVTPLSELTHTAFQAACLIVHAFRVLYTVFTLKPRALPRFEFSTETSSSPLCFRGADTPLSSCSVLRVTVLSPRPFSACRLRFASSLLLLPNASQAAR